MNGKIKMHTKFCLERLKGSDHLEDISIDGMVVYLFSVFLLNSSKQTSLILLYPILVINLAIYKIQ